MSHVSSLPPRTGRSATVRLTLYIGATAYNLSHVSVDRFVLREETILPGISGIVHVQIDDQETRKRATWGMSDAPRSVVMASFSPLS